MFESSLNLMKEKLIEWWELLFSMFPNFLLAIFIIGVFLMISKVAKRPFKGLLVRLTDNKAVVQLFSSALSVFILGIGLFIALSLLKLDRAVTSLMAGAGVLGLALGFAFQEIASNFVSGVLISFHKPYQVGDIVEVDKFLGEVVRIDLRVTLIRTFQGLEVLVPNKTMFTSSLINYTLTHGRRLDFKVGVSYGEDLDKVERVAREALQDVRCRTGEDIEIYFHEFGDSSINLVAQVWIEYPGENNYWKAHHDIVTKLKKAFNANDITIPFPIRTLDFGIKGGKDLSAMLPPPS